MKDWKINLYGMVTALTWCAATLILLGLATVALESTRPAISKTECRRPLLVDQRCVLVYIPEHLVEEVRKLAK